MHVCQRRRKCVLAALAASTAALLPAAAFPGDGTCITWPAWENFKDRFIEESGRVVDPSTPERHTTSEGQSYALFYALVANDRAAFEHILRWTANNLANGNLAQQLPAWQWGRRHNGSWGVIDKNPASDSDLWIAYVLGEAGRLWQVKPYRVLAEQLGKRILAAETVLIPGFGRTLLPGPEGFQPKQFQYRLNPSYVPIQLMRRFAALYRQPEWEELLATSIDMVVRSAPRGFAPDWVVFDADSGFGPDTLTNGVGSYNAIRVYLWAGTLARGDPVKDQLVRTLAPAVRHVAAHGAPALTADTQTGQVSGDGPAGFSAAMLPFLVASNAIDAFKQQRLRVQTMAPLERSDNYYDQVLTLFSEGWLDGHYHFARNGALRTKWKCVDDSRL